ncbi:MAG TPA: hypothetical protein VHY77_03915 [Acidimicrobiales bacterium]|nr:hypothetical protein [Acidimicrobiales bacterium]
MNGRRQLRKQIGHLLADLGTSHDEVAASLQRAGVRAVPRNPGGCAIALYLGAVLGTDSRIHSITVGTNCLKASTLQSTPFYFYGTMLVPVPKPVGQFITAFDEGRYPELVRVPATSPQPRTTAQ